MNPAILTDAIGRTYQITPSLITSETSSKVVPGSSAVIVITGKSVNDEFIVTGIHDFQDATHVAGYFKKWDHMDANGNPMHADRQLGATHYGIIPCHPSGLLDLYLPLAKAYRQE